MNRTEHLLKGTQELIKRVSECQFNANYNMCNFDSCVLGTHFEASRRKWSIVTKELFGTSISHDGDHIERNKNNMEPDVYAVATLITTHADANGNYTEQYLTRKQWLEKAKAVEEFLKAKLAEIESTACISNDRG